MKMRAYLFALLFCLNFISNFGNDYSEVEENETDEEEPEEICGKLPRVSHFKIFRGELASKNEIPWAALLLPDKQPTGACSGSLITYQHVLLAAHCFRRWRHRMSFRNELFMMLGSYCTRYPCKDAHLKRVQDLYFISRDALTGGPQDVAIVKLQRRVIDDGVWPLCLPSQNDKLLPNERIYVAGWGLDPGHDADTMLHKLGYSESQRSYTNGMYIIKGDNRAVCVGDSGVGLYRVKNGTATVFGVLSGGTHCELMLKEGLKSNDSYVSVTAMLPWIQSVLKGTTPEGTLHFTFDRDEEIYKRQD